MGRHMFGRFLDWFGNLQTGTVLMTQDHYRVPSGNAHAAQHH